MIRLLDLSESPMLCMGMNGGPDRTGGISLRFLRSPALWAGSFT